MAEMMPPASPPDSSNSIELTPANVGLAFGLTIAAGAATSLGAALAFLVRINNHRILALALGVSAGVMLYVSFVEIFATKSIQGFEDAGFSEERSYQYATLSFFGGMVLTWILDQFCHFLIHLSAWLEERKEKKNTPDVSVSKEPEAQQRRDVEMQTSVGFAMSTNQPYPGAEDGAGPRVHHVNSTTQLVEANMHTSSFRQHSTMGEVGEGQSEAQSVVRTGHDRSLLERLSMKRPSHHHGEQSSLDEIVRSAERSEAPGEMGDGIAAILAAEADHHPALRKMSLLTILAVTMHNVPEGLATFLGTLADPTAGIAIAVAIALHNIPEGIVVAMPIYYATGSKCKAFMWGSLSGMAEPIGAVIGYAGLHGNNMPPLAYALLFGLVAGIMVWISVRELLPTALKYDPDDTFTTLGVFAGFAVMAASLMMFKI